ncbi:MAG: hypothetical protein EOO43_02155 [Flavobacterium sp.]|nr:MAG: hypothetical protein EOO43_02155 [Flavobacterium sp.]
MKFKILILFVCFLAIANVCSAYAGNETGPESLIIIVFAILATILNCFLTLILLLVPWRATILFGNFWILLTSAIVIVSSIYFINNYFNGSEEPVFWYLIIAVSIASFIISLLRIILLIWVCNSSIAQQKRVILSGQVLDELKNPLSYATVKLTNADKITYTNTTGDFSFSLDATRYQSVNVTVSIIGMVTIDTTISAANYSELLKFNMKSLNLNLNEVQINSQRKQNASSNSSILFDRQAIEQLQAFSLTDILNNLPGKVYSPLDLQGAKNITLRTTATGNAALSNSLGTAIIVDGVVQSNNANMQNKSVSKYGMTGSTIDDTKNGRSYDVTFGGIDLRDIPADNIESIEVIQGVAPAQYGDLTDGAVIINRQAGRSDYQFSSRFNGGSTNIALSKGFKLKEKFGAINSNINYTISNNDPRDKLKQYSRITSGLMWTSYLASNLKNTLSFDFAKKFDDAKQDPDDGTETLTYSKNTKYSISNRTAWEIENVVLKRISLIVSGDLATQESYTQRSINSAPKAMANKDTTGIYEGFYIPGNYIAVDHVVGKPINATVNVNISNEIPTGSIIHFITAGSNFAIASNKGAGVLADPDQPRFANLDSQNERPYNFDIIPSTINSGVFIQDQFSFKVFKKTLGFSAGIRFDSQNGFGNFQPRINTNYSIAKDWKINLAYGVSTKAPTLAHRYPSPTYFDIPLINYFTGNVNESLLLVYTEKITPDNSQLKPSKSNQLELGLTMKKKHIDASIFSYYKKNTNGFNTQERFYPLILPNFNYIAIPGQKPKYFKADGTTLYAGLKNNIISNNVSSENYGIEFQVSTKKIKQIQTSFSFNSVCNYSTYHNSGYTLRQASLQDILANKKAFYAIYNASENVDYNIISRLNTDTHIPKLGFVVSLILDVTWQRHNENLRAYDLPIAYIDKNYQYYNIDTYDPNNTDYNHFKPLGLADTEGRLPFSYANLSMRLSKEIKKRIRFSINAYNVFNIQPQYYNPTSQRIITYNDPLSIGAEFSIKF